MAHESLQSLMASRARGLLTPHTAACALLVLFAWLVWQSPATPAASFKPSSPPIPHVMGPWTATPLPVTAKVTDILETDDVTLLEYRREQEPPVWFARVGGFGTRAAFHPPELCYIGSHFEVLERGIITVTVDGQERRLMRLVLSQDHQRFEAWYWFTASGRVTPNYYQQQFWLLADTIHGQPMSGTLVRISTPIDDSTSAHERLLAFVTALQHGV